MQVQYGFIKSGTRAKVLSSTLAHESNKLEMNTRKKICRKACIYDKKGLKINRARRPNYSWATSSLEIARYSSKHWSNN